jgi:hypothetical protein
MGRSAAKGEDEVASTGDSGGVMLGKEVCYCNLDLLMAYVGRMDLLVCKGGQAGSW